NAARLAERGQKKEAPTRGASSPIVLPGGFTGMSGRRFECSRRPVSKLCHRSHTRKNFREIAPRKRRYPIKVDERFTMLPRSAESCARRHTGTERARSGFARESFSIKDDCRLGL